MKWTMSLAWLGTGQTPPSQRSSRFSHRKYILFLSSTSLQVHYCYATEGPMKLAAALMAAGGGGGDCLAQVFQSYIDGDNDVAHNVYVGVDTIGVEGGIVLLRWPW